MVSIESTNSKPISNGTLYGNADRLVNKATPRAYHTLRQIVQRIPRWLIEKTANAHGVDARKFSATSHFVMLILGHLSRASCLTEICDGADLNKRKLSLVRIEAGKPHDSAMADGFTKDMKGGDINFGTRQHGKRE